MWIKREKYEELLGEINHNQMLYVRANAQLEAASTAIKDLRQMVMELREQVKEERVRAENAVDELLKVKVAVDPVSPHNYVRRQQAVDITDLDNIFEEEDPEAVKRLLERMETEGPGAVYSEALEEMSE